MSLLNASCIECSNARLPSTNQRSFVLATDEIEVGEEVCIYYGDEVRAGFGCIRCGTPMSKPRAIACHAPINPSTVRQIEPNIQTFTETQYVQALQLKTILAKEAADNIIS
jgi:hypothetical protein